jgi:O-antigen/teichoic acid export membrane protein
LFGGAFIAIILGLFFIMILGRKMGMESELGAKMPVPVGLGIIGSAVLGVLIMCGAMIWIKRQGLMDEFQEYFWNGSTFMKWVLGFASLGVLLRIVRALIDILSLRYKK